MVLYGLIGNNLGHTFSPAFFSEKFIELNIKAAYQVFELDNIDEVLSIVRENENLAGFNVTIPFKKAILKMLNEMDPVVSETGSANTVKVIRDKQKVRLKGYNTDVVGFEQSLLPFLSGRHIRKALVLGTGGSAAAVSFVLHKLNISHLFVSRNPDKKDTVSYPSLDREIIQSHPLIINTTPAGMFPDKKGYPDIPYQYLTSGHLLYDLIYNPPETIFMKQGKKYGAETKSGEEMLRLQADASWEIWCSGG
ncbi:MAG: shikimate dehydrogenase [bacterium]|jgi:shikimate dehydrogenase